MSGLAEPYRHWLEPGTYQGNPSHAGSRCEPIATDRFRAGDTVACVTSWFSVSDPTDGQRTGDRFTVRAYLRDYDYLVLEELSTGYVNASRFEVRRD